MSAILGVLSLDQHPDQDAVVRRMMHRMASRGSSDVATWREGGVALAVARHDWEYGSGFSGPVLVVQDGDLVIAADASLYYRDDLRRRLADAGVRPTGQTPSHLILAAYRAWGEHCAEWLEGDFAFVIYDRQTRRMMAARDFGGKRPLFHAAIGRGRGLLIVGSTVGGVLEHPYCPDTLNLAVIGETAAGLPMPHADTAYSGIHTLLGGRSLVADLARSSTPRITLHWDPPHFESGSDVAEDEAAEQLRELLTRATAERMPASGPSTIWLSGGYDSAAVFGCGQNALRRGGGSFPLLPVSLSYPEGDPGREDEFIRPMADHWQQPVEWTSVTDVPLLQDPYTEAYERDEPFAHLFEHVNRSLAQSSQRVGTSVAMDGCGGDQLFSVTDVYLADLLRRGNWRTLRSHWKRRESRDVASFYRWAVQPLLPPRLHHVIRQATRGALRGCYGDIEIPSWLDERFVRQHRLVERDLSGRPPRDREGCSAFESRRYLTSPYGPRIFSSVATFALEEGVELRSPLYDMRIIEFAATRPRPERATAGANKRLLRSAVRDLLPTLITQPRRWRTGIASGYVSSNLRASLPRLCGKVFADSCLAELGIAEPRRLLMARDQFANTGNYTLGFSLFHTVQAELWLRARLRASQQSFWRPPLAGPARLQHAGTG